MVHYEAVLRSLLNNYHDNRLLLLILNSLTNRLFSAICKEVSKRPESSITATDGTGY